MSERSDHLATDVKDGTLITGRTTYEIYVVRDGKLRWVPDSWTMQANGLSPEELVIVSDDELARLPVGDQLPTSVPPPRLEDGNVYESDDGVFLMTGGALVRVLDPIEHALDGSFNPNDVAYLPASIVRALVDREGLYLIGSSFEGE